MNDNELLAIWNRGMSVYYDDHMAFARAVALAASVKQREACAIRCDMAAFMREGSQDEYDHGARAACLDLAEEFRHKDA